MGMEGSNPFDLDLTPLACCARLQQLVLAVEKGLTRPWSISGHERLPEGAKCRVDLCPVSVAPYIKYHASDEVHCRPIVIERLMGPPC